MYCTVMIMLVHLSLVTLKTVSYSLGDWTTTTSLNRYGTLNDTNKLINYQNTISVILQNIQLLNNIIDYESETYLLVAVNCWDYLSSGK